jgi:hypothetical protein
LECAGYLSEGIGEALLMGGTKHNPSFGYPYPVRTQQGGPKDYLVGWGDEGTPTFISNGKNGAGTSR